MKKITPLTAGIIICLFLILAPGCNVSSLPTRSVTVFGVVSGHPTKVGDKVIIQVIAVDPETGRLGQKKFYTTIIAANSPIFYSVQFDDVPIPQNYTQSRYVELTVEATTNNNESGIGFVTPGPYRSGQVYYGPNTTSVEFNVPDGLPPPLPPPFLPRPGTP